MKRSDLREEFLENLNQNINLHKKLVSESKKIDDISNLICGKLKKGGKILFCGNGGSAADAQHMVAELLVRLTSNFNRDPLPALTLIQDISTITACGNDYNFDDVLLRNFRGLANKNDVLFAITTSGNSKNIIKVLKYAKERNFLTIGLLGNNGGKSLKYCKKSIVVPSKNTARIQECHIFLGHCILHQVEKKYFNK